MGQSVDLGFLTSKGRKIFLSRLHITQTYEGHLEGSLESISHHIRRNMAKRVREHLPQVTAYLVIDNGQKALPSFQWIADFWCRRAVHIDDPDYSSRLSVCWFTDDIPNTLMDALQSIVDRIDYEAYAEDYDIMP